MNETLINNVITTCLIHNLDFVIYRKPKTDEPYFLLQHTSSDIKFSKANGGIESYFIFHPFYLDENNRAITFIPYIYKPLSELSEADLAEIKQFSPQNQPIKQFNVQNGLDFVSYTKLIKQLQQHFPPLKKIVISNPRPAINCDIPKLINIWWQSLLIKDAFVYLLNSSVAGTWLGATPELLLSIKQQKLTTVALAGTLKKQPNEIYNWSEKERQEHNVVKDYILNLLAQQGVDNLGHSETYTEVASQVVHLKTDISGYLNDKVKAIDLAKILHPTPAIGGFPRNLAIDKILQFENYDRRYYSGFLGLIDNNSSDLFVNLRCLQYYPQQQAVQVYTGGGIMPDSDPNLEWCEMELKAQRLESCFKNRIIKDNKCI